MPILAASAAKAGLVLSRIVLAGTFVALAVALALSNAVTDIWDGIARNR